MLQTLLADVVANGGGGSWGFIQIAVTMIICLAIVAVVIVITRAMGVAIPQWCWAVVGIVAAAAVGIIAIKFLARL